MKHGYIILVIVLALVALVPPGIVVECLWRGDKPDQPFWMAIHTIGRGELVLLGVVMVIDISRWWIEGKGLTRHIVTRAMEQLKDLIESAKGES